MKQPISLLSWIICLTLLAPSLGHSAGVLDKKNFICNDAQGNEYGVSSRLMSASGMYDAWYAQVFNNQQLEVWENTQDFNSEGLDPLMGYLTYNGSYTKNIELHNPDDQSLIMTFQDCDEVGELSSLWNSWSKMLHEYNGYF